MQPGSGGDRIGAHFRRRQFALHVVVALVRDAAAARRGYRTLRFDYAQVVYDWPSVQAAILAALGA